MSQREHQASGGVTRAAPQPAAVHAAPQPSSATSGSATERPPLWEDLFRSFSAGQQNELLSLAARQGLLYSYQLPASGNGAAPDHGRHQLSRLLAGHTGELEPLRAPPVEVWDAALDDAQRDAVAKAVHT